MSQMANETAERMHTTDHSEGGLAKPIEKVTAQLPSDTFLWLAAGSIAASLAFKLAGKDTHALFVGQWAPTFLLLGTYNKIVKEFGHDKYDAGM